MAERAKIVAQQSMVNVGVRGALVGATGEKLTGIARGEALSGGLALGQSKIGDIGADKGLKAGSIGKVAMHATTGAVYSAATGASAISGAIGGAASELIAGVMESGNGINSPPSDKPLTTAQIDAHKSAQDSLNSRIKATTKLTAAASLVTGGKAKDINTAINVADSALAHNRELHESEQRALKELQAEATTTQEQQDLQDAAAFKAKIHAGVNKENNPEEHARLSASAERGRTKITAQEKLVTRAEQNKKRDVLQSILPKNLGGSGNITSGASAILTARSFGYDKGDAALDYVSSNYNRPQAFIGEVTQVASGIAGAAGSAFVTAGSISQANPVGAALGATGIALSSLHAKEGLSDLTSPYRDKTAERAAASLRGELPGLTGKPKAATSLASTALDLGLVAGAKTLTNVAIGKNTASKDTSGLPGGEVNGRVKEVVKGVSKKNVIWVDESASMSVRAQRYNDTASGARSNLITKKGQAPSLKYIDVNGKAKVVRFDGVEGKTLIDRKISVVTSPKAKNQILRQSRALKENNMQGAWEVPNAAQAKRASKMMKELDVNNIEIRIRNEQIIK